MKLLSREYPNCAPFNALTKCALWTQDVAQLIDDCMQSDFESRPTAKEVFHRIAGTADASAIIKPLASRSAASSFESGPLETASDHSLQSVPDADVANHITAQATSTDADSEPDLPASGAVIEPGEARQHADEAVLPLTEAGPSAQADALPVVVNDTHEEDRLRQPD